MSVGLNKESEKISAMFNSIAGSYDFLNHLLSFGIDRRWRALLVKKLIKKKPVKVLDIACGTGDLTIALAKQKIEVTGLDFAAKMVEIAKQKSSKITPTPSYIIASAHSIPFPDNLFDAVTIGFGIRNFEKRGESLLEINRVLKKGGMLAILEFATPKNRIWRWLFNIYFLKLLPVIGRLISKDKNAYNYLPKSVGTFPQYGEFTSELQHINFTDVDFKPLTGGVVIMYTAYKC